MTTPGKSSSGKLPPNQGQKRKGSFQTASSSTPTHLPTTGRAAKRVRTFDGRTAEAQTSREAFGHDGKVDLPDFLEARQFEISALEDAMRKSKSANTRRAFQLVPRHMRRRTASHNVKRLPKRLRSRARKEMDMDNTPTVQSRRRRPRTTKARIRAETAKKLDILAKRKRNRKLKEEATDEKASGPGPAGEKKQQEEEKEEVAGRTVVAPPRPPRPKIRQNALNDPPKITSKFKKRQKDKAWLPTHLWHAKRAKMTTSPQSLWGFAIPLTPTAKSYRPTHRATQQSSAVCWDTSYVATIRVRGDGKALEQLLRLSSPPRGDAKKWRDGSRQLRGELEIASGAEGGGSTTKLGPVVIIYNPVPCIEANPALLTDSTNSVSSRREAFLRVHPAAFRDVWDALLREIKRSALKVTLEDLRWEIGSIYMQGPASSEVLQSILRPYPVKNEQAAVPQAKSFKDIGRETSVPSDAILSFSVQDPRLQYPPRTYHEPEMNEEDAMSTIQNLAAWTADRMVRPVALFDRQSRYRATCLPSQAGLNRRRGSQVPGTPLEPSAADPPIPITLLACPRAGWTILAPRKCILPFWHSMMHYPLSTGGTPRFGGLDEIRQVAFEDGQPWFPADYPSTPAGARWELAQRQEAEKAWSARPKSKQTSWKTLDLGAGRLGEISSGFACDWEFLFKLAEATTDTSKDTTTTTTSDPGAQAPDPQLPAPQAGDCFESRHPLRAINRLTTSSFKEHLRLGPRSGIPLPPQYPLLSVSITVLGRGEPKPRARIYRLPVQHHHLQPTTTQAVVPATDPPPGTVVRNSLPVNLRQQWLDLARRENNNKKPEKGKGGSRSSVKTQQRRMPRGTDIETAKRLMAESLLSTELPYPRPTASPTDGHGRPLVPNAEDLMGFVTTGGFCLTKGRGFGLGCIDGNKAAEAVWNSSKQEPLEARLCVVRNAGESLGWLARWDYV